MSIKAFLLSSLFFAPFSMLAMKQENNNVASLKELCTQIVQRERLNYGALPDSLQDEILERKKQLNHELKVKMMNKAHPMEILELSNKGADFDKNPKKNIIFGVTFMTAYCAVECMRQVIESSYSYENFYKNN